MARQLYIGNKNYSSWSLRPWLLMKQFNFAFEEKQVEVSGKGVHAGLHRTYSPSGLVPALHEGDQTIWDSMAIAEYLAEENPALWPAGKSARAFARCVSNEMHSGFADVRTTMPMNIKKRLSGKPRSNEVTTNVNRITALWEQCRAQYGENADGDSGYLFGAFTIADAMYAPVVWRFFTYNVIPSSARARAYMATMLSNPHMRAWEAAALAEDAPGAFPGPIPHYDAGSEELGGPARPQGNTTVEDFIRALQKAA